MICEDKNTGDKSKIPYVVLKWTCKPLMMLLEPAWPKMLVNLFSHLVSFELATMLGRFA